MEEIGYRTTTFEFEGVSGHRREFVGWLVKTCAQDGVKTADLMDADAIQRLFDRVAEMADRGAGRRGRRRATRHDARPRAFMPSEGIEEPALVRGKMGSAVVLIPATAFMAALLAMTALPAAITLVLSLR